MRERLEFAISIATEGPRTVCITPLPEVAEKPRLLFELAFGPYLKVKGESLMLTLSAVQKATASIQAVDAKGNPAQLEDDPAPAWQSSDPAVVQVVASADGLSVEIVAVGPVGTAQVRVDADADLGDGAVPVFGLLDVEVVAAQAVAIVVTPGAPVDQ